MDWPCFVYFRGMFVEYDVNVTLLWIGSNREISLGRHATPISTNVALANGGRTLVFNREGFGDRLRSFGCRTGV